MRPAMSTVDGDEPAWLGFDGWTGADGELFLRADAVIDLGAGLQELAEVAERHVTDLDELSAGDSAARSRSARLVFSRDGSSWDLPAHDDAVSELMKGGIEKWEQNLRDHGFGLDLPAASCDWPSVKEIWARRHVLVHNGGLADERYLRRVPGATRGAMLDVDDGYLRTAIDLLCGFVLGVIVLAWDSLSPGNRAEVLRLSCAYAASADGEQRWPHGLDY
jgi:hypothetical protein